MGEWNPYKISKMEKEILDICIKYGCGDVKMFQSIHFPHHLCDETACMTLEEFAERCVVDNE